MFVDCSADSWNLDPALVEETLTERAAVDRLPAAVITVDLYGETADYTALESVCRRFDVPLIEDSAEALGATHRGRAAGSFGVAGIFSFNGNKIITTSGGGMLVTASPQWAERARHLATQAREPFSHYEHTTVGYNYRLSNLLAALGRAQLRGLDSRIERRKQIDATYTAGLGGLPGISPMPRSVERNVELLVDLHPHRSRGLRSGPRAGASWPWRQRTSSRDRRGSPFTSNAAFVGAAFVGPGHCARVFDRGLCLPTGSALSPADQARVVEIISAEADV